MNRPLNKSILLTASIGAILMLILVAINLSTLSVALALSLVLILPGYAMTVLLLPGNALGIPERLLLSLGLSVAATVSSGFVLHWTGWGLQTTTVWLVLLLWVAAEAAVLFRVRRQSRVDATTIPSGSGFSWRQWMLLVLAAVIVTMAIRMARTPAPQQNLEGYTLLWIQAADAPDRVRLGVDSQEFATTKYRLHFEVNNRVNEGPTLELKPGERWEGIFRLPTDQVETGPLTVSLHRLDNPTEVYRHIIWWPEAP